MVEEPEQSEDRLNSQQPNRLKTTLLTSTEGKLLLTGVALAFIYTLWLGVQLLFAPESSQVLVGMTATQVIFGRAAGMAFGYSMNLARTTVIFICIVIETIQVLILYPLFVLSWRHLLILKRLKNTFERTRRAAEKHKHIVRKYGIIGLFVFVWFPFWMTGPVVGSVIGFLLGLRVWVNMTVVLAGSYMAIFCWAFLLRRIHEHAASYNSYAAMVLMALLVVIIITAHLLHQTGRKNKDKSDSDPL